MPKCNGSPTLLKILIRGSIILNYGSGRQVIYGSGSYFNISLAKNKNMLSSRYYCAVINILKLVLFLKFVESLIKESKDPDISYGSWHQKIVLDPPDAEH